MRAKAAHVEAELERFRHSRALMATSAALFHGDDTGGFTNEADVIAHAELDFDRYLRRLAEDDAEAAVAARAKAEKKERARQKRAASIREDWLSQKPQDDDEDDDWSAPKGGASFSQQPPPAGGGFH